MTKSQYINQSVQRAIRIMHLFSAKENELSLTEISRKTGIHKSIVFRILATLESEGWLIKNPETSKYMLGVRLLSLSGVVLGELSIRKIALPVMEELSEKTGETVVLTMSSNGGAICIEKIDSDSSVRITTQVGRHYPLHAGATGLAVLMGMPDNQIKEVLNREPLEKITNKTITDPELIFEMVKEAKKDGYIISVGTVDPGVVAIGIPLNFPQQYVYLGISVTGPKYRLNEKKLQFVIEELKNAKQKILQTGIND